MTPDFIATAPLDQLEALFPDKDKIEIRRIRKSAKNALWQRRYRSAGNEKAAAIRRDYEWERYERDCREGSAALLQAIRAMGL